MKENQIQIDVIRNEPRVSAMIIADNTNTRYESIRDLIRKYKAELENFGEIPFADFKSAKQIQGRIKQVAELNEQQATLLITFLKNTKEVVAFKVNLIKAFFLMKEKLENKPQANNTIAQFMNNQQQTNELMIKLLEKLVNNQESKVKTISKEQMRKIRSNTYILVSIMKECDPTLNEQESMRVLYASLNAHMGVSSYYDIAYDDFEKVMELQTRTIQRWEQKRERIYA